MPFAGADGFGAVQGFFHGRSGRPGAGLLGPPGPYRALSFLATGPFLHIAAVQSGQSRPPKEGVEWPLVPSLWTWPTHGSCGQPRGRPLSTRQSRSLASAAPGFPEPGDSNEPSVIWSATRRFFWQIGQLGTLLAKQGQTGLAARILRAVASWKNTQNTGNTRS